MRQAEGRLVMNAGGAGQDATLDLASYREQASSPIPTACARMPIVLSVAVPVRDFRVRDLLAMNAGEVIETRWGHGEDLPLASGEVQLAWTEFEVIDTRLAVRVTRLA